MSSGAADVEMLRRPGLGLLLMLNMCNADVHSYSNKNKQQNSAQCYAFVKRM